MTKFVQDGARRYREANGCTLDELARARTERIRSHYRRRLSGARPWRQVVLRLMRSRHLARVRREVYGEENLYLTRAANAAEVVGPH